MLPLRAMRPRTRLYCALRATFTLVDLGVGPMLSRSMRYPPCRSLPNPGSADRGVSSVLRRFLNIRLLQNHIKKATKLMTATPPTTPPATAIVEPEPLRLGPPAFPPTGTTVTPEVLSAASGACGLFAGVPAPAPIVVKGAADDAVEDEASSLCGGGATAGSAADGVGTADSEVGTAAIGVDTEVRTAGTLVSATLAWGCGATATEGIDSIVTELEELELTGGGNCGIDVEGVATAGGGATMAGAAVVGST